MTASRLGTRRMMLSAVSSVTLLASVLLLAGLAAAASGVAGEPVGAAAPAEFVNISATSALSFVPSSFSVLPGASVHLDVTQMADFEHTFTLSPAVNVTLPPTYTSAQVSAFFNAHSPLVNLSLGSTPGQQFTVTFTAPLTLGTYEWVCLIHFPTMTGVMTVANSPPSSGSAGSPSTLELVEIGALVGVVAIVVAVAAWSRARRRSRKGRDTPPPT